MSDKMSFAYWILQIPLKVFFWGMTVLILVSWTMTILIVIAIVRFTDR
jgi:hypothetical protein